MDSIISVPQHQYAATPGFRGLLLAAGRGSRFDGSGMDNKLLAHLPGSDMSLVEHAARSMLAALPVLAVVSSLDNEVAQRLAALGCELAECRHAADGMSASLMCGVAQTQDAAGWIVALGDMPFVQTATHAGLLAALRDGIDIAVPSYQGRRGNPVAFSQRHRAALLQLRGDTGARALLQTFPVRQIPVNDGGIHRDIDTRDDLIECTKD